MMEVKWFSGAEDDLIRLRYYSEMAFGKETAKKIIKATTETVSLLGKSPLLGPLEPLSNHRPEARRSLVVHKNIKAVYLIGSRSVNIAVLWDTRRESSRMASYIDITIEQDSNILNSPSVPYTKTIR